MINSCNDCGKKPGTVSAVIKGELVKGICESCYQLRVMSMYQSSAHAQYERERDVEDHAADVAQPRVAGKPNPDFIRNYPERAKDMFTEEELRLYG